MTQLTQPSFFNVGGCVGCRTPRFFASRRRRDQLPFRESVVIESRSDAGCPRSLLFSQSREARSRVTSQHSLRSTFRKVLKEAARFGAADMAEHFHRTYLPELRGAVFEKQGIFQDGGQTALGFRVRRSFERAP